MPVRSLNSSVIKWPEADNVIAAVSQWAREAAGRHPRVVRIGIFGSYATDAWGVGSDVDLIIIVEESDRPFEERSLEWNTVDLPVPADVLVYTKQEWASMKQQGRRITHGQVGWVYGPPESSNAR